MRLMNAALAARGGAMPGSHLLSTPSAINMQRAIRSSKSKSSSSRGSFAHVPLLQRIAPVKEQPPVSTRRAATTVAQGRPQRNLETPLELPNYSYLALSPSRQLVYIRRMTDSMTALRNMTHSSVVGFDIEWRPNFVKGMPPNPVACVQLSNQNSVIIVQISALGKLPAELTTVLTDPRVTKVGVAITDDARKLSVDWGVSVENVLDLSTLARSLDPYWAEEDRQKAEARNLLENEKETSTLPSGVPTAKGNKPIQHQPKKTVVGLARLTARYLTMQLAKGKRVTMSNWEKPLTEAQLTYAANDAAVAFDIHEMLQRVQKGEVALPGS